MRHVASAPSFVTTRLRFLLVALALTVSLALVGEAAAAPDSEVAKLTAGDADAGDKFGFSVAVSGDTAVVGSPLDDDGGNASGSAYVYVRDGEGWSQQA